MTKRNLEIHSENILPIIKKWLYSDKDIFVRELVSNAVDAIRKVKFLIDRNEIKDESNDFKIEIKLDKENKTLTFSDNGIGMTEEEVQKYIAQIAFSGAEDFVNKYKEGHDKKDEFIGHFGLGFYSAYMVANKVEIQTLSYKEGATPVFWSCDGSSEYIIEPGQKTSRGTEITLYIEEDSHEYLEEAKLKEVLDHYCSFLPFPVYFGEELINKQQPLWVKNPSECTKEEYLEFYRHLYPMDGDPLFWIHINVDYPFHLKGILYFPKIKRDFDPEKTSVKLYCNRVFVSDNCKDIVPNYLMALRGVIDSPDIPLNVSRSYLQMDKTVRQLSGHISKKVSDSLTNLYKEDKVRFIDCWNDISVVIKLGSLEDDKFFDRVKDVLIWKTTEDSWLTAEEYLERNKEKTDSKIYYTKEDSKIDALQSIYKTKGIDVLISNHPIDMYVMQAIERKMSPATFQRVDASLTDHLLDQEREDKDVDAEGKTISLKMADFVKLKLQKEHLEVEAKSLANDNIAAILLQDEHQRRMQEYMRSLDPQGDLSNMDAFAKKTLVINTNSPLMHAIYKMENKNPELAKELMEEVYDSTLLSQEMNAKSATGFIHKTMQLLEKLASEVVKG